MTAFRCILACSWTVLMLMPFSAHAETVRVYVTNSAGDSIHVVDPAIDQVVQVFKGPEAAHGIAFAPDSSRVYVSNEAESTLDVFDRKSGHLIRQVRRVLAVAAQDLRRLIAREEDRTGEDRRPDTVQPELE